MATETDLNMTLQTIAVIFVVAVCVVYVIRRIVRRGRGSSDAACRDCPVASACGKEKRRDCTRKPGGGCGCGCH